MAYLMYGICFSCRPHRRVAFLELGPGDATKAFGAEFSPPPTAVFAPHKGWDAGNYGLALLIVPGFGRHFCQEARG